MPRLRGRSAKKSAARLSNAAKTKTAQRAVDAGIPSPSEDCELDVTLMQEKFVEAHEMLIRLVLEVTEESEDKTCAEAAEGTFNAQTADMVSASERATDKIEESENALAALGPVLEEMTVE